MKKVLIVNATAIGENKGTGVTLRNIWNEYPKENLMQLIVDWNDTDRDRDVPTVRTPVEFCRIPYTFHRKVNRKRKISGGVANGSIKQKGFKSCLHDCLRGMLDAFPVNYSCIMDAVREFAPDVVYTCGPSIRVLKTAYYISKKLDIPMILHLMDDWPETIYTTSVLSLPFQGIIKHMLAKIHKRCKHNFAISEAMGQKYSAIYGTEYRMLMNPAMNIEDKVHPISKEPKFLYAGSLNLNRWKSLLDIAEVLDMYRKAGHSSEFTLYVPKNDMKLYSSEFEKYGAVLKEYVSAEKLREIYENSDVLVFAESFDDAVVDFAKYSLSTKIPEYMATGHMILAYLPETLYSCRYMQDNQVALVSKDKKKLASVVEKIFLSPEDCLPFAENAIEEAKRTHSREACREKLLQTIHEACH